MQLDTHLTVDGFGAATYSAPPFDAVALSGASAAQAPAAAVRPPARHARVALDPISLSSEERGVLGGTQYASLFRAPTGLADGLALKELRYGLMRQVSRPIRPSGLFVPDRFPRSRRTDPAEFGRLVNARQYRPGGGAKPQCDSAACGLPSGQVDRVWQHVSALRRRPLVVVCRMKRSRAAPCR
jgi:hypothetical protein